MGIAIEVALAADGELVDEAAGGRGIGEALTRESLRLAAASGARPSASA